MSVNRFVVIFMAMLGLAVQASQADETLTTTSVRQAIETFKNSSDYVFAPATLTRAQAYLGAAMLANDEHKPDEVAAALEKASQTLVEARHTSSSYQQRFSKMLTMRRSAKDTLDALKGEQVTYSESPQQLLEQADVALRSSVAAMEKGQLNQTQQQAEQAEKLYRQALEVMLPPLSSMVSKRIAKASYAARRYTPKTLQKAKEMAAELRAYVDGLSESIPEHPAYALYLARETYRLSKQIKAWTKNPDSFEKLLLKNRQLRITLASELHLPVDTDNPVADVPAETLIQGIQQLQARLQQEKQAHKHDIEQLRQVHQQELENKLAEQRNAFLQAKNEQLSSMKEAFRAKLERETFEKNRQAKVIRLFKPGEASILANLDGSLVVRLTALQFAPNKSKIDKKYKDLLTRLKKTLDVYADRSVRIEGHTDNQGDIKSNQLLSLKRAESVRDFLIAAGVDGARLKALGYGEVRPIASNDFAKGRAMNRRIDIIIDAPKQTKK